MPSYYTLTSGTTAQAQDVNQIINALNGSAGNGIPTSLTAVNDSVNFALAVKNADATNSRALQVLKSNGNVLLQADVNGVIASADGGSSTGQVLTTNVAQTINALKTFTAGMQVISGNVGIGSAPITSSGIYIPAAYTISASVSASGFNSVPTLVAQANNDILAGVASSPTFNDNGKTGVTHNAFYSTAGDLYLSGGDARVKRLKATLGTAVVNGDFALSAGWGSTGAVAVAANSTDQRGSVTITPGGTGIAANPTVTLTFHDGTWTNAPFAIVSIASGVIVNTIVQSITATTLVFQPLFTPSSGTGYAFTWLVLG